MGSTEAERSVVAYLSSAPGTREPWPGWAARGQAAHIQHSGGWGAIPTSVRFRRARAYDGCYMYAVSFRATDGPPRFIVVRAFQAPDGTWAADPVGGEAGPGPRRLRPWVNFTARGGPTASDFAGGGEVIGEGSEHAHKVLLRFADGTTAVDEVEDGLVLFYVDHRVTCPGQVTVLDAEGLVLSYYAEFELFA